MFVYGPVPSRRLGRSLGVSPIPSKTCSYNCVYCQLGRTNRVQLKRESFHPRDKILAEIEKQIGKGNKIDYITFVGDGEPTLCNDLGWLIAQCKQLWQIPVAVITNGSLLFMEEVRYDLIRSDVVLPSLDAGSDEIFRKINRPHHSIKFNTMLDGLVEFSHQYKGMIWLEVMLVAGVNDSDRSLMDISNSIERMQPDRVYVSVPIRPPAESWVTAPDAERIIHAHEVFGTARELTDYESGEFGLGNFTDAKSAILEICSRHPLREEQAKEIEDRFSKAGCVDELIDKSMLDRVQYRDIWYLLRRK
jgi:wyosine [tRNA(Phe)-imidazoG37] synthetase (radical SAM superfamily)